MSFCKIDDAIKDLQRGKFIILVDDEDRENEGDLVIAAEKATPSKLNYMLKNARGIMCFPVAGERLDELGIPLMVEQSNDKFKTPFTISIDAKKGITTGVSVFDRAATIKAVLDKNTKKEDLAMPGHMFPLRARKSVLERAGHTEAAVELCRIGKLYPAAVIAEIMNDNGEMAKLDDLVDFAEKHKLKIATIKDLIKYVKRKQDGD